LLAALLASHALLAWVLRQQAILDGGDDSAYLLLARGLRRFSYREVQYVTDAVAARFPPGYPALLSVSSLGGEHFGLIALAGILVSVSGLYALFDVVRRRWSADLALLVTAPVAANPALALNAGMVASESLFTALTLWTLWAAARVDDGEKRGAIACAAAIGAAMTRSAGVTLIAAVGLHWLIGRRFRLLTGFALASALTVGAWLGWTAFAPQREVRRSYVDDAVNVRVGNESFAAMLIRRATDNVAAYATHDIIGELGLPVTSRTKLDNVAWLGLIVSLGAVGMLALLSRWRAAALYLGTYGALLVIWAFNLARFLQPLLPFVVAAIVVGAWTLGNWLRPSGKWGMGAAAAIGLVFSAMAIRGDVARVERALDCERTFAACARPAGLDFLNAARESATLAPPGSRFVTPKAATFYYYSGHKGVYWDEVITQDSASFLPFLERNGVRYVLATPVYSDYRTVLRLTAAHCTEFDLLKAFSRYTLLLSRRDTTSDRNTRACRAIDRAARLAPRLSDEG
jgi:hypothetical protein